MSRLALLAWVNEFLDTDYPKVEALADGVAYAQIFDAVHPGILPLHELSFDAKFESARLKNLRLLEKAFRKANIRKVVPVADIAAGKFASNREWLAWCKDWIEKNYKPDPSVGPYPAYEKRKAALARKAGGSRGRGGSRGGGGGGGPPRRGSLIPSPSSSRRNSSASSPGGSRIGRGASKIGGVGGRRASMGDPRAALANESLIPNRFGDDVPRANDSGLAKLPEEAPTSLTHPGPVAKGQGLRGGGSVLQQPQTSAYAHHHAHSSSSPSSHTSYTTTAPPPSALSIPGDGIGSGPISSPLARVTPRAQDNIMDSETAGSMLEHTEAELDSLLAALRVDLDKRLSGLDVAQRELAKTVTTRNRLRGTLESVEAAMMTLLAPEVTSAMTEDEQDSVMGDLAHVRDLLATAPSAFTQLDPNALPTLSASNSGTKIPTSAAGGAASPGPAEPAS